MLALGLASAPSVLGQGTIVYHQPLMPLYPLIGQELDLNGEGQLEFRLYDGTDLGGSYFGTSASGLGLAQLLVTPRGPNDTRSYLVGLSQGFLIGGPLSGSWFWAAHDAPNKYGQADVLGTFIPGSGNYLIPDGYFYNTTAFMGIHFQIGQNWHYGWVRIRGEGAADVLAPQGWILDWAYESRPDTPIFAGAVPEPSSWALLGIGGFTLLWAQRRRRNI